MPVGPVDDHESTTCIEGVLALDPGNSIPKVHGGQHLRGRTRVGIQQRIETRLKQERTRLTGEGLAEARVSKVHNINEARVEDGGVLRGESFAVVAKRGGRRLSGKLRGDLVVGVVG